MMQGSSSMDIPRNDVLLNNILDGVIGVSGDGLSISAIQRMGGNLGRSDLTS